MIIGILLIVCFIIFFISVLGVGETLFNLIFLLGIIGGVYWFFTIFIKRIEQIESNQKILMAKIKALNILNVNRLTTDSRINNNKIEDEDKADNLELNKLEVLKPVKNITKNLENKVEKSFNDTPSWLEVIHWEDFLGRKLLGVLGAISIVFAIGFFMKWAFNNGFIGPHGRLFIGFLISGFFIITGELMRPKYPLFFDKLVGTGVAGILVTTFLGRIYIFEGLSEPIISSNHAFMGYIFAVVVGLFLSLRYNSRFLGNFTTVAGLISPFLVDSNMDPMALLIYLSVLVLSSFVLALKKQWPEIWGILFIGILPLEGEILGRAMMVIQLESAEVHWQNISPVIYLFFIFGLHYFLASGGIVRSLYALSKNKKEDRVPNIYQLSTTEIFESLLLIGSVIVANIFASLVFYDLEWNYLGFFVLSQGFLLFGLAELFKKYKIEIFRKILIGGTLTTILFATIWENSSNNNEFTTMLLLAIEGILFILAGKTAKESVFEAFGKIALSLSTLFVFNSYQASITEVFQMFIISPILIAGFLYSVIPRDLKVEPSKLSKIWGLFSLIMTSSLILNWSFESRLSSILEPQWYFLTLIIPGLWAVGLAFSVVKTKQKISGIAALIFLIILGGYAEYLLRTHFNNENIPREIVNFVSYLILLAINFGVLFSFFIKVPDFKYSVKLKKIAIIGILFFTTLYTFNFINSNFRDPIETLLMILWSSILLGFGYKNNWRFFRYFGIGMFLFIIAQIYLDKIWAWETGTRVLAFSILGLSLLGVSFFYQKNASEEIFKNSSKKDLEK